MRLSVPVLLVLLALAMIASVALGAVVIPFTDLVAALRGTADATSITIIRELRLPRMFLGTLVGVALGMSGTTLQATLRNGLAEPYLLGVSGGAAVGAVLAYAGGVEHPALLSLSAFGGALLAIVSVLVLGRDRHGARTPAGLLMAGVVIGAFANATIMVLLATASDTARRGALWWMMGSLASSRWQEVLWLGITICIVGGALLHLARSLDVLTLGDDAARALGERADALAIRAFVLASLLAAVTVATAGLIGFVGLMVPHVARRLVVTGSTRATLGVSALAGAALVLVADVVARLARAPIELPLGAITALVGVPFFFWRLRRGA